jgi:hypothetical protein
VHPKKVLPIFLGQTFLGALFTKVIYTSLRRDNELFSELKKGQKWKKPLKISKNGFL